MINILENLDNIDIANIKTMFLSKNNFTKTVLGMLPGIPQKKVLTATGQCALDGSTYNHFGIAGYLQLKKGTNVFVSKSNLYWSSRVIFIIGNDPTATWPLGYTRNGRTMVYECDKTGLVPVALFMDMTDSSYTVNGARLTLTDPDGITRDIQCEDFISTGGEYKDLLSAKLSVTTWPGNYAHLSEASIREREELFKVSYQKTLPTIPEVATRYANYIQLAHTYSSIRVYDGYLYLKEGMSYHIEVNTKFGTHVKIGDREYFGSAPRPQYDNNDFISIDLDDLPRGKMIKITATIISKYSQRNTRITLFSGKLGSTRQKNTSGLGVFFHKENTHLKNLFDPERLVSDRPLSGENLSRINVRDRITETITYPLVGNERILSYTDSRYGVATIKIDGNTLIESEHGGYPVVTNFDIPSGAREIEISIWADTYRSTGDVLYGMIALF